jgi:hypothetical protein
MTSKMSLLLLELELMEDKSLPAIKKAIEDRGLRCNDAEVLCILNFLEKMGGFSRKDFLEKEMKKQRAKVLFIVNNTKILIELLKRKGYRTQIHNFAQATGLSHLEIAEMFEKSLKGCLYSANQASHELGIKKQTLLKAVENKKLKAVNIEERGEIKPYFQLDELLKLKEAYFD